MSRFATGKLFSGLVVGVALGAGVALVLSSRANISVPGARAAGIGVDGPTPFEPANVLIARARNFVDEVRSQVRQAVDEGRATAAQTRQELTARFEAAKRDPDEGEKG
jgi:hypothetical protein